MTSNLVKRQIPSPQSGSGGIPTTAQVITVDNETATVPNSRQLVSGLNTTVDTSTPGQIKLNVAAPTGDNPIFESVTIEGNGGATPGPVLGYPGIPDGIGLRMNQTAILGTRIQLYGMDVNTYTLAQTETGYLIQINEDNSVVTCDGNPSIESFGANWFLENNSNTAFTFTTANGATIIGQTTWQPGERCTVIQEGTVYKISPYYQMPNQLILSTATINALSVPGTFNFNGTIPAGSRVFYPRFARVVVLTADTVTGPPGGSIGTTAPYNNIVAAGPINNLTAANTWVPLTLIPSVQPSVAAGEQLTYNHLGAATATALTFRVDIIGDFY